MPYVSRAQDAKFHVLEREGKISPKVVREFDRATKRQKGGFKALPERVGKKRGRDGKRKMRRVTRR